VFIRRSACAQKHQLVVSGVFNRVPEAWRDGDRIAGAHGPRLAAEGHRSGAGKDVVDLLGHFMVMGDRGLSGRQPGLSEALVADGRVAMGHQLADCRAVDRREGSRVAVIDDVHAGEDSSEPGSPLRPGGKATATPWWARLAETGRLLRRHSPGYANFLMESTRELRSDPVWGGLSAFASSSRSTEFCRPPSKN